MSLALTHLENQIFRTGIFSSAFKTSRILQLKKQGKSAEEFNSYWPINNLNPMDKVIEELIRTRIEDHLLKKKVIPNNHHGSCGGHSTLTPVQEIENRLKKNKANGETSVILATDLLNAFDIIDLPSYCRRRNTSVLGGRPLP